MGDIEAHSFDNHKMVNAIYRQCLRTFIIQRLHF